MSHPDPTEEYDDEDYREAQAALPPHKREGYGEMILNLRICAANSRERKGNEIRRPSQD